MDLRNWNFNKVMPHQNSKTINHPRQAVQEDKKQTPKNDKQHLEHRQRHLAKFRAVSDEEPSMTDSSKPKRRKINWLIFGIAALALAYFWPLLAPKLSLVLPKSLLGEQCSRVWINSNLTHLKQDLDENVFGQHVATRQVLAALQRRWAMAINDNASPEKPLVLSFHGWTGSGKNYMAKFIADALYERGMSSRYVHFFSSTLHFEDPSRVLDYQVQLQQWIRGNVSLCPSSLFIIDEVDKMPAGVLDGIGPFMDHHEQVDGVDFRESIFILLSNTGGREITKITMEFWHAGQARESMTSRDLEGLISRGVYNEEGGFHHTALIEKSLIDYHVPFLPLEKRHVKGCIAREMMRRGLQPKDEIIDKTLTMLPFWPKDIQVFASSGCKRVIQKLGEVLFDD